MGFFFFTPPFFSLQNNSFCPTQYGLSLLFAAQPMMSMILIYVSTELSEWLICWIFHSELSADWVSPESSCRLDPMLSRLKQLESTESPRYDIMICHSTILLRYAFSFLYSPKNEHHLMDWKVSWFYILVCTKLTLYLQHLLSYKE